jgi:hypothetical protein
LYRDSKDLNHDCTTLVSTANAQVRVRCRTTGYSRRRQEIALPARGDETPTRTDPCPPSSLVRAGVQGSGAKAQPARADIPIMGQRLQDKMPRMAATKASINLGITGFGRRCRSAALCPGRRFRCRPGDLEIAAAFTPVNAQCIICG